MATKVSHRDLQDSTAQASVQTVKRASGSSGRSCWFAGYESVENCQKAMQSLTSVSANVFALLLSILAASMRVREGDVTLPNRLLLFLMKIKLRISFTSLFSIHPSTSPRIFYAVLAKLASATRGWITVPSRETILATSPKCFKVHYPECTFILDCTEMKTEMPPTLEQRRALFSNFKGTYTLKFLVGILPNGMIAFISKAFGGRATDSKITVNSGFLKHVHRDDVILCDKGFPGIRTDIEKQNAVLVMPPFASGHDQFTEEKMDTTYNIAQVRIHVERVIQRVKIHNILNTRIPVTLIPYMDDIFHVCSVLTNFQSPVLRQDED